MQVVRQAPYDHFRKVLKLESMMGASMANFM